MKREIDLSSHCVHTEIKGIYNRLVRSLVRGESVSGEEEAWVDLLAVILTRFDFPATRAMHPALAGKTGLRVCMETDAEHLVVFCIDGKRIPPVLKA